LLDLATLALSNDTGPRHIAVALGRPVVVVMGPTDPRHTAHLLDRQRVLVEEADCSPCHLKTCPTDHRCMTRLAPERVIDAARGLLS
jgi:heptosyltransferase-2